MFDFMDRSSEYQSRTDNPSLKDQNSDGMSPDLIEDDAQTVDSGALCSSSATLNFFNQASFLI